MSQAMFNSNSISQARVNYPNNISIYIVNSTVPDGRTAEDEIGRLRESNRQNIQALPDSILVSDITTLFGPTIATKMRNVRESTPQGPFPLVINFVKFPDDSLMSISVHRVFVRGPDRIEVAGLKYFQQKVRIADEEKPLAELTTMVDAVVESLQQCTSKMPIRGASRVPPNNMANQQSLNVKLGDDTPANPAFKPSKTNDMPELTKRFNCWACHSISRKVIGPAWMDVSSRYKNATNFEYQGKEYPLEEGLLLKVSQGGSGHWGQMPMPAIDPNGHMQTDIKELITFILGLSK
jgi:cytochrome c551/c552